MKPSVSVAISKAVDDNEMVRSFMEKDNLEEERNSLGAESFEHCLVNGAQSRRSHGQPLPHSPHNILRMLTR